jgi:hypothetical protein
MLYMNNITALSAGTDDYRISAPVAATAEVAQARPEFIPLPQTGKRCPFSGLSRSTLNSYILPTAANGYNPPVRSYALRQWGKMRGRRLIDFQSLCSFIRSHSDAANDAAKPQNVVQFSSR